MSFDFITKPYRGTALKVSSFKHLTQQRWATLPRSKRKVLMGVLLFSTAMAVLSLYSLYAVAGPAGLLTFPFVTFFGYRRALVLRQRYDQRLDGTAPPQKRGFLKRIFFGSAGR